MWFSKRPLHIQNCDHKQLEKDVAALLTAVNRLEIEDSSLRERLDSLEGRHASLSASVRGRLGGRPNARTGLGNHALPLPLNPMIRS